MPYIYAERCKLIDLLRNYNNLSGAQIALRVIHGAYVYDDALCKHVYNNIWCNCANNVLK